MKALMMGMILMTVNAVAAELKIYEASDYQNNSVDAEFKVNEEMGRAWVELSLTESFHSENSSTSYERVKVDGLSLVGGTVVYDHEGQQIECAHMRTVGIFRFRRAKPTGNCKFKTVRSITPVDDGFEVRRVPTISVFMVTK